MSSPHYSPSSATEKLEALMKELVHADSPVTGMDHAKRQMKRILCQGANLRDFLPQTTEEPLAEPLELLRVMHTDPNALMPTYPQLKLMYDVFSMLLAQRLNGSFPTASTVSDTVEPYNGRLSPREYLKDLQYYAEIPAQDLE